LNLGLFEERAILFGKLGRHAEALSIYINILNDIPAAIEYCDLCYQSQSLSSKEVGFIVLTRKCLITFRCQHRISIHFELGCSSSVIIVEQVYYYLLKLLLQPNEALAIPGLAYPLTERKTDIKTALEVLDRFPARIDPIKVPLQISIYFFWIRDRHRPSYSLYGATAPISIALFTQFDA